MKTLLRVLKHNGLSLFFGVIFLAALFGQSVVGEARYNEEQRVDGRAEVTYTEYVTSSDFAVDVTENWQSEYLQFLLYILATVWLVQRGSPESKELDKAGMEDDAHEKIGEHADADSPKWARAGGLRARVYSWSLTLLMATLFFGSWGAQSIAGLARYNEQQLAQQQDPVRWAEYVAGPDFWSRTLQNWQSEFLAVGSMVVFSIYLRQRGSPESKPVGAPHAATSVTD
ncbi:MAG: hypothetical protein QOD92_2417 [Acidimicrobiaceae bacterium]